MIILKKLWKKIYSFYRYCMLSEQLYIAQMDFQKKRSMGIIDERLQKKLLNLRLKLSKFAK